MKNTMKMVVLFNILILLLTSCARHESSSLVYIDEQVTATVTRVEKSS